MSALADPADPAGATIDDTLAALADPLRRQVVELLAQRPMRPSELVASTATTASTMSKHLRVLRRSGLVVESHPEFDARVRIYTLQTARMSALRSWLAAAEQGWADQLTAFAEYVDGSDD